MPDEMLQLNSALINAFMTELEPDSPIIQIRPGSGSIFLGLLTKFSWLLLAVLHRVITECGTQDLDEKLGSVCEERLLLVHERDLDNSNLSGHLGYCLGTGETVAIKKVLQDKNLKRFKISGKSKKVLWRLGILVG
ncbi:uncharacterized protein LOC110268597 isoform X2 [Arachis ipaensis]|uniref:uncharacterized protein n=1 Tax=Arachis hypogaea TaxID=3818 RepID=UPI000A2B3DDA|nr:uncharacterized protein LOC110268597 isoform X2 [Arachis ipaensis]XP_029149018.1 uncharacterized protein LOC112750490 [Arachis hypogaea]XP_029149019.1 uncharacterized protein LOC112750490 [Arachis hypogaea]XP_029149020.1 uncharacterized protein LOC112750490 [Arachis hypogaea]